MAEDIITASVDINMGGISGDVTNNSSSDVKNSLGTIISLLKDIRDTSSGTLKEREKESKLSMSGLKSLGTIGKTIATILGVGPAAQAGMDAAVQFGMGLAGPGEYGAEIGYDEEGNRNVYIINQKTGEIAQIWTEKEAIERGILTKSGQMRKNFESQVKLQDLTSNNLEEIGKNVILTNDDLMDLADETLKQSLIAKSNREEQEEERRLRIEINKMLAAQLQERYRPVSSGLGYEDTVAQQSVMYTQFQLAALEDLARNTEISSNNTTSQFLQLITPNLNP